MNVLVATDGSKYGRWGLNWAAKLPFVKPPRVTVLHVLDHTMLSWPFRTRLEIQRVKARAAKTLKRAKQQLASLNIKGTAKTEQGEVASVILKRAPDRNGLLVVGTKGLNALDRFLLGSVSTKLIEHAPCPVLIVKGEAVPLRRITLATDGSAASAKALEFVLSTFQPDRSSVQYQAGADSCERDPCEDTEPVGSHHGQIDDPVDQISRIEGGREQVGRTECGEADPGGILSRAAASNWEAC